MKSYFYSDGNTSIGPFTLEDLKKQNINQDTLIWYQGLEEWTPAGELSELADLFELNPPPIIVTENNKAKEEPQKIKPSYAKPPKTWLVESILSLMFCCFPFSIAGIVNAARVETLFYAGLIDEAKEASAKAKKWVTVSFWVAIGLWVLYFVFIFGMGLFSALDFFSTFDSIYGV